MDRVEEHSYCDNFQPGESREVDTEMPVARKKSRVAELSQSIGDRTNRKANRKWGLGAKGIVQVRVIVGKDGLIESAQVLRGLNPYYDRISREAAEKFRFKPGTVSGKVVRFSTNLFFEF